MAKSLDRRNFVRQHKRRLMILLRALLPNAADATAAWRETLVRVWQERQTPTEFARRLDDIARDVAAGRRKTQHPLPFSDDLFRQLADSANTSTTVAERRPQVLGEILDRLPPPEKELLRRKYTLGLAIDQIAVAEGRPAITVSRDLTILRGTLVATLQDELPDGGPASPGGASDLGRLVDQLLDDAISEDGRMVLETLLLADAAAQAHYHRHVALAVELEWKFRGEPEMPDLPVRPRRLSLREWLVTIAFIVVCIAAVAFVVLRLGNHP